MKSGAIKGIQFHNQREAESKTNPDIRKEDAHLNYDLINGNKKLDYKNEIQQIISEKVKSEKKIRKDAIHLAEILITSDSPFFDKMTPDEQRQYFETAKQYVADNYGEENIIYATVHNDEKTPHMHVGVVPVTKDGRLSAKDVFGNKLQFVKLQDSFNAHVRAHGYDLERGVSSDRKHMDVAKFKAKTAYEAEKEATLKYEQTISQIQAIDEHTTAIEDLKPKQMMGYTALKNDEYKELVAHAINSAVFEVENTELKHRLNQSEQQLQELKQGIQKGQDKIRKDYYRIELDSNEIQENLEEKVHERTVKALEKHETFQKYVEIKGKYEIAEKKIEGLEAVQQSTLRQNQILKAEKEDADKKATSLQGENDSLREQIEGLKNDFEAWKLRVRDVLHRQFDILKTLLRVRGAEPELLKTLDKNQDKIVGESLKEMEKPKEKTQIQEMEL